jgi:uncharacterized membrane protein
MHKTVSMKYLAPAFWRLIFMTRTRTPTGAFDSSANPLPDPLTQDSDASGNSSHLPAAEDSYGRIRVRTSAIIQSDPVCIYLLWRDVESAPIWQEQIVSVTARNATLSHWVMKSGDLAIEWDMEILADEPGRRIAWASVGGVLHNSGEVFFEEVLDGSGTQVTVFQEFRMGNLACAWQSIAGSDPGQTVIDNLLDFKALVEKGEIERSGTTPSSGDSRAA